MSETQTQTLFKYSQEKLSKKIDAEEDIKIKKKQYKETLNEIQSLYFPEDKITINPNTEKKLTKYKGIESIKCFINKDNKSLKYILIEYKEFVATYSCGGDNQFGDSIKGYSTGYDTKQIKIYNNKFYNCGQLEKHMPNPYNEYHKQKNQVLKQSQEMFEDVKQKIKNIFGIKTFAEKQSQRFKKRIL